MKFDHLRHQPPSIHNSDFELLLIVPKLHSNVNLARIIRTAGCCGVKRTIVGGNPKIDPKIARDSVEYVDIDKRRTVMPLLPKLKTERYELVGLEQASNSTCIYDFKFPRKTALIIGHERLGIEDEMLNLLDHVVEIPVFGRPFSYNVATAVAMVLYEYCRQANSGISKSIV